MDSVLKLLPPAVRDNLGLVTIFVGAGVFVVASELTKKPAAGSEVFVDTRKLSSDRKTRPPNELPQFKTDNSSPRLISRRVSVAGESVSADSFKKSDRVVHPKSGELRERISRTTQNSLLLRNLDHHQSAEIVDAMFEVKVPAGKDIIKQGDEGDNFYIVDSGLFEIFVDDKKVAESREGNSFGELALLYDTPRAATVRALRDSVLWAVDRLSFRRIVLGSNMRKRQTHEAFLKSIPLLSSLNPAEIVKVVDALQPEQYKAGATIIQEGDSGDTFYLIEEGDAVVHKLDQNGVNQEIGRKTAGDYFGEIALLTDGQRVASVTALTDIRCLVLDQASFTRLLGPCVEILKRNISNYQQYSKLLDE